MIGGRTTIVLNKEKATAITVTIPKPRSIGNDDATRAEKPNITEDSD